MRILEIMLINAIIVAFPILVYQFFTLYMQNMKKEKIEILLSFSLLVSLYLSMFYKSNIPIIYQFNALILPVFVSYFAHKPRMAILISIVLSEYFIKEVNYNFLVMILFIILFCIYFYYSKRSKSYEFLTNSFLMITPIFFVINEISNIFKNKYVLLDVTLSIILFVLITKIISYALKESENIIKLHANLKAFEKEKSIRLSLFKITHEIKNPIAVVKGYLDMFDIKNQEKSTKYIGIMKGEIDRTLNLLTDFMEFSKIKVEKKEISFNSLIDDVKDVLVPFFISKNITYSFDVEENIFVYADYLRMKQVILNIIKNAVEACQKNIGHVSTTVFTDTSLLCIFVEDNGSGMSKETLDNMLEPFYTTKEKGTGLGVSLSKEIVNSHGGEISYTSVLNKGTVCKITLPLSD